MLGFIQVIDDCKEQPVSVLTSTDLLHENDHYEFYNGKNWKTLPIAFEKPAMHITLDWTRQLTRWQRFVTLWRLLWSGTAGIPW